MIRVLVDTNVLASAIIGESVDSSLPGEILRRWRTQSFALVTSDHVLQELERALAKPYFHSRLTPRQIALALRTLRVRGEVAPITMIVPRVATHPEDDLVLAAAVSAQVDYLVTGDRQLFKLGHYQGVTILAPAEFLALLDQRQSVPDE